MASPGHEHALFLVQRRDMYARGRLFDRGNGHVDFDICRAAPGKVRVDPDGANFARDDAAKAAEEAQRLQVNGRATSLAVVDAQRTLAAAEQALAQMSAAIASDQVAVFLALGDGWEESI